MVYLVCSAPRRHANSRCKEGFDRPRGQKRFREDTEEDSGHVSDADSMMGTEDSEMQTGTAPDELDIVLVRFTAG